MDESVLAETDGSCRWRREGGKRTIKANTEEKGEEEEGGGE